MDSPAEPRAAAAVPGTDPGEASSSPGVGGWLRRLLPSRTAARDRGPVDQLLLVVTVVLVALGIVMIYSSSAIRAQERFGDPMFFLKKQAGYALVGLLAMVWAWGRSLKTFQRLTPVLFLGSLLLLILVLMPHVGVRVNGARRWIRFFGVSFQPAEFAKLALILFLASYFARRRDRLDRFLKGLLPPLVLTGIMAGLVILQPNFGTACILLFAAALVFFIGGARISHLALTAAAALPVLLVLILQSDHGRTRLYAMFDPSRVSPKATYQLDQSFIALGPGGLFGRGLGNSMQKLFFLPEPHTDFIFAIVGEETGFVGAVLIVLFFAIFLWRGTRAAVRSGDQYASCLAMGITGLIVGQAALNMGVVSGLLPTTGVPLPFVSFGGSSLTVTLLAAGMLLNVSRLANRTRSVPGVGRRHYPVVSSGPLGAGSPAARSGGFGRKGWQAG